MRLPRLFLDLPLREGERILLPPERARYLRDVLRVREGAELELFNGKGGSFLGRVVSCRRRVEVAVGAWRGEERESPLKIALALAIPKGERMDFALQKATELGVSEIAPLLAERTVVRLEGERVERRLAHWRGVVVAACQQCGRNRLPEIAPPEPLPSWLARQEGGVLLDPGGEPLSHLPPPRGRLLLLIGPEGGFSPKEREAARARGFVPVSLGPRILRVETAALAALAAVQLLWGDLG